MLLHKCCKKSREFQVTKNCTPKNKPGKSSYKNISLALLVLVIMSSIMFCNVQAIGISPGRTTLDFRPGYEEDVEFTILNNEHKDMNVMLYVKEGEYSDLIKLYDNMWHI